MTKYHKALNYLPFPNDLFGNAGVTFNTASITETSCKKLDADDEWNFARLYSSEAGAFSDENPMMSMLPGFTGFIATIGLLGAALIRRE